MLYDVCSNRYQVLAKKGAKDRVNLLHSDSDPVRKVLIDSGQGEVGALKIC